MPFLGQDWRSPGDQWVRSTEGWQKMDIIRKRLFGNLLEDSIARFQLKTSAILEPSTYMAMCRDLEVGLSQSYIHLKEVTNEQTLETPIAEALAKLDLPSAVRDSRRLSYVCQLLQHLVGTKMNALSGEAQKIVVSMVECVVMRSLATKQDLRAIHNLLDTLDRTLNIYFYDHVGCATLWEGHMVTCKRLTALFNGMKIADQLEDDKEQLQLTDLPEELLAGIIGRLADPIDLSNVLPLVQVRNEVGQWRQCCVTRFTDEQLVGVLRRGEGRQSIGWEELYRRCIKRYGFEEHFADMLHICRHCNTLFWKKHGHPCPITNPTPLSTPVPPTKFSDLFST